jgi:hypothetical protein
VQKKTFFHFFTTKPKLSNFNEIFLKKFELKVFVILISALKWHLVEMREEERERERERERDVEYGY